MPRSNRDFCPACGDVGKVKIIKNVAQVGPYHLGKESLEKCKFCSTEHETKKKIIITKGHCTDGKINNCR